MANDNISANSSLEAANATQCSLGLCFKLDHHMVDLLWSSIIFMFSIVGNTIMFFVLIKNLRKNSRVNRVYLLLLHLNIANIIVTLISLPLDIVHKSTVQWYGPEWSCKLMKSLNLFGLYLASYVLICMSVDRVFAIVRPLYSLRSLRQVKVTLVIAWMLAGISSLPQAIFWNVYRHPKVPDFHQCLFDKSNHKLVTANTLLMFVGCYLLPVSVIIICYTTILVKIVRNERQSISTPGVEDPDNIGCHKKQQGSLRRSSQKHLRRAKIRTLKMTFAVVLAFLVCWTPYFVMVLISLAFSDIQTKVPSWFSRVLYGFAMSNTAVNPYLYGYFSFNVRRELSNLFFPNDSYNSRRDVSVLDTSVVTRNGQDHLCSQRKTVTISSCDEVHIIRTSDSTMPPGDQNTEESVLMS